MPDTLLTLATVIFTTFAFIFGTCFGSFLNVVVWRLPRRMPIVWARSHCPKCQQEILGRDNIPILGWLWLRGKCRFCSLPISSRYPLVETAVGCLFAGLFLLIVVGHGQTLPLWTHRYYGSWLTEFPTCPLLAVFIHQTVLGYFLMALWLIDEDRQKSPWGLTLFALLVHSGLLLWHPELSQLDFLAQQGTELSTPKPVLSTALISSASGLVLAGLAGATGWIRPLPHQTTNSRQSLVLLGVFLGPLVLSWSAVIAVSSLLTQKLNQKLFPRGRHLLSGLPLQLFLAWLLILCTWRWWPQVVWQH